MSWVVIVGTILISYSIVIFMNKRLTLSEIYATVLFGLFLSTLTDAFASTSLKAWGFYEIDKVEFKALNEAAGMTGGLHYVNGQDTSNKC